MWTLMPPTEGGSIEMRFMRAAQPGWKYRSMEELGLTTDDHGWWAEMSYRSGQEIGFAASVTEAEMLIERLRGPTEDLPSVREVLESAGFDLKYQFDTSDVWTRTVKSGELSVSLSEFSVAGRYEPSRATRWYNLASICTGKTLHKGGFAPLFYPSACEDPLLATVVHLIEIAERRLSRGGQFIRAL